MILSKIYTENQLQETAKILHSLLSSYKIITFTGDLGAGKTTLIASLLKECGIQEVVQSPTFSYVNIYTNSKGQTFYHFDLYRMASQNDFCFAGFQEYLYVPESWAFIEWPAHIMPLLTHDVGHAFIEYEGIEKRKITLST